MQNMISSLAQEEMKKENIQKQLLRHQKPIAFQVTALAEMTKYVISLIPAHLKEPLIESVKNYVIIELDKLK